MKKAVCNFFYFLTYLFCAFMNIFYTLGLSLMRYDFSVSVVVEFLIEFLIILLVHYLLFWIYVKIFKVELKIISEIFLIADISIATIVVLLTIPGSEFGIFNVVAIVFQLIAIVCRLVNNRIYLSALKKGVTFNGLKDES